MLVRVLTAIPEGLRSGQSTWEISPVHWKSDASSHCLHVATSTRLHHCHQPAFHLWRSVILGLSSERLYWSPGGLGVFHCGRSDGFFTVPDRHVHLINGCCYSYRQSLSSLCSIGAGNHWFRDTYCWVVGKINCWNFLTVHLFIYSIFTLWLKKLDIYWWVS